MLSESRYDRPLRVLSISSLYPTKSQPYGGIFIHRLHREFHHFGAEVVVAQIADWHPGKLTSFLPDPIWRSARERRLNMLESLDSVRIAHPVVFSPRPSRFFLKRTALDRIVDAFERWVGSTAWKPDILLAHFALMDGVHAVEVGKRLSLPVAIMTWGDDIHAWPEQKSDWANLLRDALSRAQILVSCSRQMARDAVKWGMRQDNSFVVYGGVDTDLFIPSNTSEDSSSKIPVGLGQHAGRRVLLCVARIERAKGHEELLDAFTRCAGDHPEWDLLLVGALGDGTIQPESLIKCHKMESRVHWIGSVHPDDLPALYRSCDGFVLPSHREGLSLSLLEALASGLRVVTTDVGGHSEVVDKEAGWLIPAGDTERLELSLRELFSQQGPATPKGARRAAERVGTPRQNAGRLVQHLRAIVSLN